MAYQVISQNNTTTTLADENGNVIRVPARVTLATSTDYTITKVNNTTATLEDGNGNIIRDVPCVAVLVGGEGGGGGAVSSVNGQTGDVVITGNDVLPDQTGQSGKFLTTDGTDASWSDKPLVNEATGTNGIGIVATTSGANSVVIGGNDNGAGNDIIIGYGASAQDRFITDSVIIGRNASASGGNNTVVGNNASASSANAIVIGRNGKATSAGSFQFGAGTNGDANTVKFYINGQNYELLSADGTIPTARLTKVNTTVTLAAADWSSNTQTVSVTGMTATGIVMVSPDPTDQSAYTSAGVLCTAQAAGTLTFTCDTVPAGDLSVNVVML